MYAMVYKPFYYVFATAGREIYWDSVYPYGGRGLYLRFTELHRIIKRYERLPILS